nr:serine hydrolase [Bacillus sp. JCM 19034]
MDKKWKYSNVAIGLLGNVLAEIVGLTYEEAITSHILHPLGMKNTFVTGNEEQHSRYISAYNKKGERIPPFLLPAISSTGGLKSTMNDMLQYLEHQMGILDSPLKEEIECTHEFQAKTPWKNYNMGLGWLIAEKKWSDYPVIYHDGKTTGFHTYCGFIKEKQIGIVVSSTIQLKNIRLIQILLNLSRVVNEDIAESIFKHNLNKPG